MMILLNYPPLVWYQLVYGNTDDVIERTRREVEWTPEPGSPSVGLFQFLPSTWEHHAPEWTKVDHGVTATTAAVNAGLTHLRETFRKAGMAATRTTSGFEDMTRANMRAQRRDTLHREASAALARGDRKAHRRALSELRTIERKH